MASDMSMQNASMENSFSEAGRTNIDMYDMSANTTKDHRENTCKEMQSSAMTARC